jgi:hypothetical protein
VSKREKACPDLSRQATVLDQIEEAVNDVGFGSVTLILQDSKVIQIEKLDKIRVGDKRAVSAAIESNRILRKKLTEAMQGMDYGQVTIVIQHKRVVQIERTEKQRVNSLEGLYGDGI